MYLLMSPHTTLGGKDTEAQRGEVHGQAAGVVSALRHGPV